MWDTVKDLILLFAIGGWLMLWLLRERGHFGVRRGMTSAPRPSNVSSLRRPGIGRTPPDGDASAGRSPHNVARHMADNVSEPLDEPGRGLGSGSRRRSRSARGQRARAPRLHAQTRRRSSPRQTSPQQRSVMPDSTNHARSNP